MPLVFEASSIFWVKACNLLLPRISYFTPLLKSLFIKAMALIFTTILLQVRFFSFFSWETFNTLLNHKQHLSIRPDGGVTQ